MTGPLPHPASRPRLGMIRGLGTILKSFFGDRRGSILVELAFAVPIVLVMVMGTFDTARYLLLHQKMDRVAATMADLVSRPVAISGAEIDTMFNAAVGLLEPFDLANQGRVVVSSVSQATGDSPRIDWQHAGAGSLAASSELGAVGEVASLPGGFTMRDGENVIVAEVFFDFEAMFVGDLLGNGVVSHDAVRMPRRGDLSTLN